MFYIGLYREKHRKIFLSGTIRPRSLIFGIKHHLVDFLQVSSNYAPGAKVDPTPGVYWEKHGKIFSETIRPRALIFGM